MQGDMNDVTAYNSSSVLRLHAHNFAVILITVDVESL